MQVTERQVKRFLKLVSNPNYELRENVIHSLNGRDFQLRYALFDGRTLVQGISLETYEKSKDLIEKQIRNKMIRGDHAELSLRVFLGVVFFQIAAAIVANLNEPLDTIRCSLNCNIGLQNLLFVLFPLVSLSSIVGFLFVEDGRLYSLILFLTSFVCGFFMLAAFVMPLPLPV